jgi:hypothetical protein
VIDDPSKLSVTCKSAALARIFPTFGCSLGENISHRFHCPLVGVDKETVATSAVKEEEMTIKRLVIRE